ncbi:LOW QUALITY PROTEIN: hypothetical protein PHMEG_00030812 [Phytophthora megakarya]|uniref:Reverse transcriptase n=1 Tax=Phytophthora megakarya TaxID=4795 RepID=A0A225V075_9STRA|nr:LOW QUALITY PROTEIN: hypothetical protein PHMEG_00030812 [Phytophthora megakarya]
MPDRAREISAFITPFGLFEWMEDLLEACDKWNLSISVAKSFWGMDKNNWDTECRSEVSRQARKT